MTAIKGFVETLKTTAQEDPLSVGRFLDIIDKQAQRLESLVNDLLILSAIESKEVKMNIVAEPLNRIVQNLLTLHKKVIEDKGHQMAVDIPADLPKVLVDRQRIEQVFLNLLDNAAKFTPAGGRISIQARLEKPYVRIEFRDTGVGIPSEHLSRVFERFYRVDRARSREAGGTGLGLAIVRQIVASHQGKVEVESKIDVGSTFRIFLPAQI